MKLQEVPLRATTGKIKWWQAAELIGILERQMCARQICSRCYMVFLFKGGDPIARQTAG